MMYRWAIATNASFFSSGDGVASRICFTTNSAESLIGYLKRTSGPMGSFVVTWNGILLGAEPSTGTRQIFPPYDTTIAVLSGVNEKPGYASSDATDSWSSR